MNKAFENFVWKNFPSSDTPVNDRNLNKVNNGLAEVDRRVIVHDTTKLDKAEARLLVKNVSLDETNGILTVTYGNGSVVTYRSLLGKISINFDFNRETQKIILYKADGDSEEIDLSAFIMEYEFFDTDTIAFRTDPNGRVSAIVKEGSIQEKHLQPNYLADIRLEASKAESSRSSAERSAKEAESFTHGGTGIREGENTDNAEFYKNQARSYSESLNVDSLAKKDGSNLSIPTAPATNDESTAPGAFTFDSFFEPDGSIKLLKEIRTFLGTFAIGGKWSSVISVRHRNGFGDGASFGMYLRSKLTETGDLSWGKQIGRYSWQDERVILDSENYSGYAMPLSGGTISGTIVSSVPPQTALDTLKGKAIINSIASGKTKGFVGLAKMNSTNGVFAQGVLDGAYIFGFAEDSTIAGNQSTMKYGVILLNEVGNSSFPGRVTASSFKGNVEGNATSATKASQDGDGNVIKDTYWNKSKELIISKEVEIATGPIGANGASGFGSVLKLEPGYKPIAAFPGRISDPDICWNSCHLRNSSGTNLVEATFKNTSNTAKTITAYATVLYLRTQ